MSKKVKQIIISNLKAVKDFEGNFEGCSAIIIGGNRKGKSSILKSLPDRLRQNITSKDVLRHEEEEGRAEWTLTSGEKLIWYFDNKTKVGERLVFVTADNIKTQITKEIMLRFFPPTFDLDKFLNESPKEQQKILQKIIGVDFTEIDGRYKVAFDARTLANNKVKDAKARLQNIDASLPEIEIDVLEVQKELSGIDAHNRNVDYVERGVNDKKEQISKNEKEIERLQKQIKELEKSNKGLAGEIKSGEAWIAEPKNARIAEKRALELQTDINEAQQKNISIRNNNHAKEQKIYFDAIVKEADAADAEVQKIDTEKQGMLKKSKMPEGFGFSEIGITYHNLEFSKEQLSSSEIYIAALKLAAMNLGDLRAIPFDASYLDKNSLQHIEDWAKDNDLQLLIERPDFDGGEIEYHLIEKSE